MPELPEVETTRRGLLPLLNQRVQSVTVRNHGLRWPIPANLPQLLQGQHFLELTRRAKYILVRCEKGVLMLHLGMSGRLSLLSEYEAPAKHDHLDVVFENGKVMRLRDPRRFGAALWLEGDPLQHALLKELGVEPLEHGFDGDYLFAKTRKRTAPIKTVIMDSHLVVGVGNIYASESLFRAGISPKAAANKVSLARCQKLAEEIKATLTAALAAGGSSLRDFFGTDGNPGYFQQEYFVYGRSGAPCKNCGGAIKTIKQGQRSTFYCPQCQG